MCTCSYVVQEVCEGGNLKAMLIRHMTSRTPMFEKRDALRWSLHVATAMHYLHHVCRPMIIHRDMKVSKREGGTVAGVLSRQPCWTRYSYPDHPLRSASEKCDDVNAQ
jgi:serine/threonine protein kinase